MLYGPDQLTESQERARRIMNLARALGGMPEDVDWRHPVVQALYGTLYRLIGGGPLEQPGGGR